MKGAMEFLHDCDLLKIEDILPFFPDFVTIDHFKVCFFFYIFFNGSGVYGRTQLYYRMPFVNLYKSIMST